mmetsp:Transcript_3766/g.11229  ORF Transcript_3766/g.11229 Transcript_3766/m.11229 type:complete len:205 (+) Transcript_3766:576-1190(+)
MRTLKAGTLASSELSWTLLARCLASLLHICISVCTVHRLHGTPRTWICTASTIYTLVHQKPGTSFLRVRRSGLSCSARSCMRLILTTAKSFSVTNLQCSPPRCWSGMAFGMAEWFITAMNTLLCFRAYIMLASTRDLTVQRVSILGAGHGLNGERRQRSASADLIRSRSIAICSRLSWTKRTSELEKIPWLQPRSSVLAGHFLL